MKFFSIKTGVLLVPVVLSVVACTSDDSGNTGGLPDTATVTDSESIADTATRTDSGAPSDSEQSTDTAVETDTGAGGDTDTDTDGDTEENPYADPSLWDGCPSPDGFQNASEDGFPVTVTDQAVYCATFIENETLKAQLERKALLRVAPGRVELPTSDSAAAGLPFCLREHLTDPPAGAALGTTTYTTFEQDWDNTIMYMYTMEQPLTEPLSGSIQLSYYPQLPKSEPLALALDGRVNDVLYVVQIDPTKTDPNQECMGMGCAWRAFDSCTHRSSIENRHTVTLDTGTLELKLRIRTVLATGASSGTERGAFVSATGTYNGQAVDQHDYFKLVYAPTHHHFVRDFAVLFDAPIDGACGAAIMGLEPEDWAGEIRDEQPDQAFAVDCELNPLQELTVLEHRLVVDE